MKAKCYIAGYNDDILKFQPDKIQHISEDKLAREGDAKFPKSSIRATKEHLHLEYSLRARRQAEGSVCQYCLKDV